MESRFVWYNIRTGKFGDTFSKEGFDSINRDKSLQEHAASNDWTCIEYTPHFNDFTFCDRMQIVDIGSPVTKKTK